MNRASVWGYVSISAEDLGAIIRKYDEHQTFLFLSPVFAHTVSYETHQKAHRYTTLKVFVSPGLRGAFSGRPKSLNRRNHGIALQLVAAA